MLVYLVCEEIFSPHKEDTLVYDRFISLLKEREVDAVLIANTTDNYRSEIDDFKAAYGNLVGQVVESETPINISNKRFHLRTSSLVTHQDEIIYAVDDTVCQITVDEDGSYEYQYLCLDLFDSEYFEKLTRQAEPKHIIIPFQEILKLLEQSIDEDTAELLKKAKAEFYYKTKS